MPKAICCSVARMLRIDAAKNAVLALAALWLSCQSVVGAAERNDKKTLTEPEKLLRWASKISHRPMPPDGVAPRLVPISGQQMSAMVCPENPTRCLRLAAVYSIRDGVIYHRDSFTLSKAVQRAYIVHEMVHFLQHLSLRNKINDSCQRIFRLEREAYGVQAAFLRRHGSLYAGQAMPRSVACLPGNSGETGER